LMISHPQASTKTNKGKMAFIQHVPIPLLQQLTWPGEIR
jgi:hypothetical protein